MGRTLEFTQGAGSSSGGEPIAEAHIEDTSAAHEAGAIDWNGGTIGALDPPNVEAAVIQAHSDAIAAASAYGDSLVDALKNGAPAGGDTLSELDARIALVEALGSLATDAELASNLAAILGSATSDADTLGELEALNALRMLKSANLSDVANAATALANLGGIAASLLTTDGDLLTRIAGVVSRMTRADLAADAAFVAAFAAKSTNALHVNYGDGSGDETTTSTSFADVPGMTPVSVTAAVDDVLEVEFIGQFYAAAADGSRERFDYGGVSGREHNLDIRSSSNWDYILKEYVVVTAPMRSSGLVAVKLQWAKVAQNLFLANNATKVRPQLAVRNRGPF